jgi:hypothetical protein
MRGVAEMTAYSAPNGGEYQIVIAMPSAALLQKRLKNGLYLMEDEQLLKRCSRCKEHWPADSEFFYVVKSTRDGLYDWCKACYQEWRYPTGRNTTQDKKQATKEITT